MARGTNSTIHVLHVVPTLGAGGMELAMSRVVNALASRGMRHSVVCLKGPATIRDRFDETVSIHCMHAGSNDPRLLYHLCRLLRRLRPSLIHARNWGAWPDVALARLLTWPRVPLVFSFHGLDATGPMPWRRRFASRILSGMTTHIFTVSQGAKRMLIEEVGLPPQRIEVIPNGVDTKRFTPCKAPSETGRVVVGSVGSLTPVKNHALLIRACADLLKRGADLKLRIAGEGPERARLSELAESLNVAERVHLFGYVTDVPRVLHGLDMFVLSSDSEAHPNALLEAMACGLPCVATRVGGVPEVLGSGRFGMLVKPGNENDLVRAIAHLAHDPAARRSLGWEARERVCKEYSLGRMLDAYEGMYREVASLQASRL